MERTIYFDYLRVFAVFAVVVLHVSAQNWYVTDVDSLEWQVFNFADSIVRWSVPVFVMISGALFLEREIPIKRLYSKYILRLLIAFLFWSFVYALFVRGGLGKRFGAFLQGHYHMWFIPMIIGVYMCIPFIKSIVDDKDRTQYFLLLSLVFVFIVPECITLIQDFLSEQMIKFANAISKVLSNMNLYMIQGYTAYFILGYCFNRSDISKKHRIIIYLLGIAGAIFTIVMDSIVALKTHGACDHYYTNLNFNVLLETLAVFVLFKHGTYSHKKLNVFMKKLSDYSFGVYLVHPLILEQMNKILKINTLSFHPILSIFILSIVAFVISMMISAILHCVPGVNKTVV